MNIWNYEDKAFEPTDELLEEYQGFVYRITELNTGKMYIGKKFFWKPKILPVTKTRKRRKKTKVQSDWMKYFGSSEHLKESISEFGEQNYFREILHLCRTKGDCSYWELYEQMINHVLLDDNYYNAFIGCKIHANHLYRPL